MSMKANLIMDFKVSLDDLHWYETPNGTTFNRDNALWVNEDNPSETLTTMDLAIRCANEQIANNENEEDWSSEII